MILLGAFRVQGMGKPYDVRVGDGVLEALGRQAAARSWRGQALVVGDSNTAATHGAAVGAAMRAAGFGVAECCLRAGESFKTLESVSRLWQEMLNAGIDRGGTVVAVGGGVVGDLSGFAAATWMRGVRWIGVPTSLLAMVDSSLGGKTAFDLPEGKNLVGAFHPPALVAIDIATLHTLPAVELRCGLAEAVKHGVLGDAALFERFEQLARRGNCAAGDLTSELVARSMAVKIRVIESDPFEKGEREGLNLGHTVGHALEIASGFALRHGEAVAIGMVAEARLAEGLKLAEKGLAERIAQTLRGLGLPTTMSAAFDHEHFMKALQRDKKRRDGAVRYALPRAIGAMELGVSVCPSLLEQVMQSMG